MLSLAAHRLRRWERLTRPVDPTTRIALRRRWAELPQHARTAAQTLGQHAVGCEGTHGVFPRCNLACKPCYHSRDANRVRVDGRHTIDRVTEQMRTLRHRRGPRAHAQLIGGEVSLLAPDDHFVALQAMREQGREPMSMSHGDFDYEYLHALAIGPDGQRRLDRVSFAGHFDMSMFGRRGIPRPGSEADLDPYRRRFTEMFQRLRREHGVQFFLAHTMMVTPRNVDQVAGVVASCRDAGFGMFSFQPAAFVGDDRRWHGDERDVSGDQVWAEIERGAGSRLPFRALQTGDERCNRTTHGFFVGERYVPILDDECPADLRVRDAFFRHLGGVDFAGTPLPLLTVKLVRAVARHPSLVPIFGRWLGRTVRRTGPVLLLRHHRIVPVTFVMHSFMDAVDVAPAWAAIRSGEQVADPRVIATQERLRACSYAMAHPETGEVVPACVQHSLLDPAENVALRRLLPMATGGTARAGPPRNGSSA